MLLPFLLLSALHAVPAADSLTGTWQVTGDVVGNPINEVCTLKQAGATLTGSCKNTDAVNAKAYDVTGEFRDGKVAFHHGGEYQGDAITITYTGIYAGAPASPKGFKGSVDVLPFGVSGTFTAAPAPATAAAPKTP